MTGKEQRDALALEDRIRRARTASPARGVEYYVLAGELAKRLGVDVGDVMDDFDHEAAILEYEGGTTRQEAERNGWLSVEERYLRQLRLSA